MLQKFLNQLLENPALFNLMRTHISGDFTPIRHELVSPQARRILDIACGTAFYSRDLYADQNIFYCGVDSSPVYVSYAVKNFSGGHFIIGDAFSLPIASGSFDRALSLGFLHHIDDRQVSHVLQEIHRVLKPGGTLLLAEPVLFFRFLRFLLIPTRVLVRLDRGQYVRCPSAYNSLFPAGFTLLRDYPFRNGPHDWWAFVLRKKAEGASPDGAY